MKIAVIGAGGYVGCVLTQNLLLQGHEVNALDLYIYGDNVFEDLQDHKNIRVFKGDIRDEAVLAESLAGCDAVIHLACISNDPSFDLDPELSKSINLDSFDLFLSVLNKSNVKRLIFASSSSVYGVSESPKVLEETEKKPLTDYAKYKLSCEQKLSEWNNSSIKWVVVRPATICGYSPRLRLDLTVNILTASALFNNKIKVFGGEQYRCSLHILDMCRAYLGLLQANDEIIHKQIFNVGHENYSVLEIAKIIKKSLDKPNLPIEVLPSNDNRSYRIDSDKILNVLGFKPKFRLEDAVMDLQEAFAKGKIRSIDDSIYHNVKRMKEISLK